MAFHLKALDSQTRRGAEIASRLLWALLGLNAAVAAISAALAGLRFSGGAAFLSELAACIGVLLAARGYSAMRGVGDARMRLWIDIAASFSLTALADLVICYAAATVPAPDATFLVQRLDHAMGFQWFDYARDVDNLGSVAQALAFCYRAWMPLMLAAMTALAFVGDFAAIGEFAIGSTLTFFATAALFACVDVRSLDSVAAYSLGGFHHPSGAGPHYLHVLEQLRSGASRTVDFDRIAGLISFPSLHGASALLLVAATRNLGAWRYPLIAFNVMVLVSTLSEGGHNSTDVVAGALIAFAAILVSPSLYRAFGSRRQAQAAAATAVATAS